MLIPRKIAAYTFHLNNTSTITDAPTIRSLKFVLADEFEDWREGEMLLQSLIETDEEAHAGRATTRPGSRPWPSPPAASPGPGIHRPESRPRRPDEWGPRWWSIRPRSPWSPTTPPRSPTLVAEAAAWVGLTEATRCASRSTEGNSPSPRIDLESIDPIVLAVEGGAFEDPKQIRQLDPRGGADVAARVLARVADRRRPELRRRAATRRR